MPADLQTEQLAVSYAALILHDENLPVKADQLQALTKAAGVSVAAYWPALFQQVFATRSVGEFLLSNVSAAPAAGGAAAPAAAAAAPAKEEKKEVKEEKKEESDDDMGFGLFD